jgi:Flp pilus assembly secretin CpaC
MCRAFFLASALAGCLASVTAFAADQIRVTLDQASVLKLPERVGTIVIGNPLIADVSVHASGLMVVTGKGYGVTNIVALDRGGNVLMEKVVQVQGPNEGVMVVYRGAERESYSCSPNCEQRITLGDAPKFFDATLNQTVTRTGNAQGSGTAAPAGGKP